MSWDDTLGNLRVLDQWRAGAGLTYGIEKPARRTTTLANRTLGGARAADPEGADRRRCDPDLEGRARLRVLPELSPAASLTLDGFYERGGNLFDTGYVYWPARPSSSSATGTPAAASSAATSRSSARARIRRSTIPT